MMGAAAGKARTKRTICRKEEHANGMARARTDWCWLELGTDSPPATEGTWTDSPSKNPNEEVAGPNELKLSDSPTKDKTKHERRARAVRWSAWLGIGDGKS